MPRLLAARAAHPRPLVDTGGKGDGPLQLRDAFGVSGTARTSAHFALRVGPRVTVSPTEAATLLDTLERGWQREVVDMALPTPIGSARYYVNLYIGNSGGGAPAIDFEGAFTDVDDDGFPYMAIHPSLLRDPQLGATTAHELFHTIQDASGPLYDFDEGLRSGWYWEASAEWAAVEVFPTYVEDFVGFYAVQPQVSVNYGDYPDEDTLIEWHQYGAAILLRYLTERIGDWTIVRDSWRPTTPASPSAVAALDRILGARATPTSLRALMADFALRNAIWDYQRGDDYLRYTDEVVGDYPNDDLRIAAELPDDGTGAGEARVDAARLPWGLAANVIRVKRPTVGAWTIAFRGDPAGSRGDAARFDVLVARVAGRALIESTRITLTDGAGTLALPEVKSGESLLLVVASIPDSFVVEETFGYGYELKPTAPVPTTVDTPDMGGGGGAPQGGCSAGGARAPGASMIVLAAFALLALARRARRFR